MSSVTSDDQPSTVLKATTRAGFEYSPLRILLTTRFIGLGLISLDKSTAELFSKIIDHNMNGDHQLARQEQAMGFGYSSQHSTARGMQQRGYACIAASRQPNPSVC